MRTSRHSKLTMGRCSTIMGVQDSNLSLRADLHPVAQVHGCLPKQGMQDQQRQGKVIHVIPAEEPCTFAWDLSVEFGNSGA